MRGYSEWAAASSLSPTPQEQYQRYCCGLIIFLNYIILRDLNKAFSFNFPGKLIIINICFSF
jgi:hypothetical protein